MMDGDQIGDYMFPCLKKRIIIFNTQDVSYPLVSDMLDALSEKYRIRCYDQFWKIDEMLKVGEVFDGYYSPQAFMLFNSIRDTLEEYNSYCSKEIVKDICRFFYDENQIMMIYINDRKYIQNVIDMCRYQVHDDILISVMMLMDSSKNNQLSPGYGYYFDVEDTKTAPKRFVDYIHQIYDRNLT